MQDGVVLLTESCGAFEAAWGLSAKKKKKKIICGAVQDSNLSLYFLF